MLGRRRRGFRRSFGEAGACLGLGLSTVLVRVVGVLLLGLIIITEEVDIVFSALISGLIGLLVV